MAFQLSALIVPGDLTDEPKRVLEALGFPGGVSAGTVPFMEATSPQPSTRTIGSTGEWTMLTDSMPFISFNRTAPVGSLWAREITQFLEERSAGGGRCFGFIMSKLSSNYGFSVHEDGEHVRSYLEQMGNILVSEGEQLDAERKVGENDSKELAIFRLMEHLEIPFHDFESVQFHYFGFEQSHR